MMARSIKQKKSTFFVCSAIKQHMLLVRTIEATTFSDARKNFEITEGIYPGVISGPFFKKRGCDQECYEGLKFAGTSKKAIYEGWVVNAQILLEPENCAYLFFKKRVDGKDVKQPDGHTIVDVQNLRFI